MRCDKKYKCCDKKYTSYDKYVYHFNKKHCGDDYPIPQLKSFCINNKVYYYCNICSCEFTRIEDMEKHKKIVHLEGLFDIF